MGSDKKQQLLGIKLKNGVLMGKKANKTTPSPSWKLGFHNSLSLDPNFSMKASVSARKIGANLWEVQPQFNFKKNNGDLEDDDDRAAADGGLIHQRRRRHCSYEREGHVVSDQLNEPSDSDSQPPEIETSLRRNIVELPSLRHLSVGKNSQDLQHISSASCCSSMQVTPYACTVNPTGYTLKRSTHLLKVINRIWNLEEQHSRDTVLIKSLIRDLDISRAQIKTLVEERKRDHQEIDELKKSSHERKKKVVQSTKDEFLEVKSSFMREKKARILLESLCDEFAKGIRDYEQKVRFLQQNYGGEDQIVSRNDPDRLILHVSEAWLDERAQMKCDFSEKTSISDNLCCEIETFLEAKKKQSCGFGVENDDIHEKREEKGSCGVITEPYSQLVSRMIDRSLGPAEPSSDSMSRMAAEGQGATEPSPKPMSRTREPGPGVTEPSSRRAREGVKANTLMAKLLEARLESQFLKSRTIRK